MKRVTAIVLAAGLGKRMRSKMAKVLHSIAGRPMVWYSLALARAMADSGVVVVVGHQANRVRKVLEETDCFPSLQCVEQSPQRGTGHAVQQARMVVTQNGQACADTYLVLNGDTPLVRETTVQSLLALHEAEKATVTMLTTQLDDPQGYGRVIRDREGEVLRIVEDGDASSEESGVHEVNVGTYVVDGPFLFKALDALEPKNAQQEYYLTDLIHIAVTQGLRVSALPSTDTMECLGINTREQLALAERVMQQRLCRKWMQEGVTMRDPDTTTIDVRVEIGRDTILHPNVTLEGQTHIGEECVIRSSTRITDTVLGNRVKVEDACVVEGAVVEDGASIGPFARLRPGTILRQNAKVGNFVEVKSTEVGEDSKVNHLSYLGDAWIGKDVNIGAGTITCNYDGYKKHHTIVEDQVFIGSGTQLIAPVTIGRGAVVGAGSTVTQDVPAGALGIARAQQVNKSGKAAQRRALHVNQVAGSSKKKTKPKSKKKSRGA